MSTRDTDIVTSAPPETFIVDDDADQVSCDGGVGALGHPRIYISFDGGDMAECGYCDRLFIKKRTADKAS